MESLAGYAPEMWAGTLKRHGFTSIDADVLKAPEPGNPGALMVRARTRT